MSLKVVVNGACGRMGQEVVKTVVTGTDHRLVQVCDKKDIGKDIMKMVNIKAEEINVKENLKQVIKESTPDVIIDFTTPEVVMENIRIGLNANVHMIVGTTGITEADLKEIQMMSDNSDANILIVPNFAIGAVLMMKFAKQAAKYMRNVEIIELHHDRKIDAPSGTSLRTADLINKNTYKKFKTQQKIEKLEGARGGVMGGIHIHSVRLPGLVAHQEVIFGGKGQTLKIRHDSYDRTSFMPGIKLALEKIDKIDNLVIGLENIMD